MSSTISVDSLLTLLKGMQREKACLQGKLQESQDKKTMLQSQVRGMNIKQNQTRETNAKLRETLNVAQAMLEKSQQQQKAAQEEIRKKRKLVDALNNQVAEEKQKKQESTLVLQQKLAEMTDRFIEARKFYEEGNLEKEISTLQDRANKMQTDIQEARTQTDGLTTRLQQLKLNPGKDEDMEIGADIQRFLIGELKRNNITTTEVVNTLSNKLGQAKGEMKNMQAAVA